MSEINFNQELFKAAMNCKDAKEVLNFAKSKGITLTEEEAGNLFAFTHKGELTDEEMDQIVGGEGLPGETKPIMPPPEQPLEPTPLVPITPGGGYAGDFRVKPVKELSSERRKKMAKIEFNKELMTALESCKDAKEVVALAKANGVTLSEEKAERICEILNSEELTDEELDMVVGGQSVSCPCDKEDEDEIKEFRNPS